MLRDGAAHMSFEERQLAASKDVRSSFGARRFVPARSCTDLRPVFVADIFAEIERDKAYVDKHRAYVSWMIVGVIVLMLAPIAALFVAIL